VAPAFKRLAAGRNEAHRRNETSRRRRLEFVHRGDAPALLGDEKRFHRFESKRQELH